MKRPARLITSFSETLLSVGTSGAPEQTPGDAITGRFFRPTFTICAVRAIIIRCSGTSTSRWTRNSALLRDIKKAPAGAFLFARLESRARYFLWGRGV